MPDFVKKINKSCSDSLENGESVEAALFVQPAGTSGGMMGRELGGVVGGVIAAKRSEKATADLKDDEGLAATLPKKALVFGLTSSGRTLVFGHSKLSGNPKGLETVIASADIASVDVERRKIAHSVLFTFKDGSSIESWFSTVYENTPFGWKALLTTN